MKHKDFIIFYCLFICINCFCEGNHNRVDLNKEECARYDIEKSEISSGKVEDYECCYFSMLNDLIASECMIFTKDEAERIYQKAVESSSLNFADARVECSSINLFFNIINIIKSLALVLFL